MSQLSPEVHDGNTITELYDKVNRAVIKTGEAAALTERLRCAKLVVDSCREAADDLKRSYGDLYSLEVLKLGAEIYKKITNAPLLPEEPPRAQNS
jgi:hypothetical protein